MRQLEAKTSVEIARWYEEVAEGFEKTLVGLYGATVVESRINGGGAGREDFTALQALAQTEPDDLRLAREALRDIDIAEQRLDQLDPGAHGVRVEHVAA
jgi:hypothetical protein